MKGPSYKGLSAATASASKAARASSKKQDTKPELQLRRAIWRAGHRYRKNVDSLPGSPDIVFVGARLAVFCDGDFWHGRNWPERRAKLEKGHNPSYWVAKIERNMERDRDVNRALRRQGWRVLRVWEGDVKANTAKIVSQIESLLWELRPEI